MNGPDPAPDSEAKPRIRTDLQVVPAQAGGARAVILHDPLGLGEKPVVLGGQALELVTMLDGRHSVGDIQVALTRKHGILVTSDHVEEALARLDDAFLLQSPRFREAREKLVREFAAGSTLEASHAGTGYPADPEVLRTTLDGLLGSAEDARVPDGRLCALVAPHIDLRVGGEVYAAAYAPLRGKAFDRVAVLGVGHSMREGLVALTDKDVETPLGTLENDRALAAGLRSAAGGAAAPDDFAFRREHSVEFQVVFLQHVLAEKDFKVVPVLCGSFGELLAAGSSEAGAPQLRGFLEALKKALVEGPGRTLLVAGADLSHVGPKFGDRASSRAIAPESEEHDRALLEALCAPDAGAFWAEGRRVKGKYHVCGFGALACLLELLPGGARGVRLAYHNWHEGPTRSAVSFAAAAFTIPGE